ncbi:pilus assembly protein [Methylocaldum sp. BRCS4]|uniref:type 4 pilus major pilin n=1 Tax=Methylocaldum sp. GT1BW TaxID=3438964 RepID=UPI0012EB537B|nr:pilus assembly protein [Methylocaldum sp. BRCS4]
MKNTTGRGVINRRFGEDGASLLEALAFIIISLLVIGAGIGMWKMTSAGSKENAATGQIMAIQTSYRGLYSGQNSYGTGDITGIGVTAGLFPSDLKISGTTVTNGWSGSVVVSGVGTIFTISWGGVPAESCAKLAVIKSDWTGVSINGTAQTLPVTPAAAVAACNAASNTLVFSST